MIPQATAYGTMQKKVNEIHSRLHDTFSCGYSPKHHVGYEKFIQVN